MELRNTTLLNIKTHLLGRDETGSSNEPSDCWDGNDEVEFERHFRDHLKPWTLDRLRLKCEDCHVESEQVTDRYIDGAHRNLCDKCYEKRTAKDTDESEEKSEASDPVPNGERNTDSAMSRAVTSLVQNTIKAVALDARSSLEKVKMLEDFKANVSKTAGSQGSGQILGPGLALLDKEIERLQKEAELGKGQDADGKPAT